MSYLGSYRKKDTKDATKKTRLNKTSSPISQIANFKDWPSARSRSWNFGTVEKSTGLWEMAFHELALLFSGNIRCRLSGSSVSLPRINSFNSD